MMVEGAIGKVRELPRKALESIRHRRGRPTFFLEFTVIFAVVALVLTLATGLALSRFVGSGIQNNANDIVLGAAESTTRQLSASLSQDLFAGPLEGPTFEAFDRFVRQSVLSDTTLRVNVWNTEGVLVYSSYQPLTGEKFAPGENLRTAFAGETAAKVERPEEEEHSGLDAYDQVIEVYTPVRFADSPQVVGAFEIYDDYGPVAAAIANVERTVFIGIAAALAALYLALVLLVRRGSNLILHQRTDLEARANELKNSYDSIVAVLCSALDLRDNVTHGHAKRVSELASIVAWQLGLRKDEVRQIEKAAILHDIGKIGVADAVLRKPGPLDEFEWEEMRRHPELGYNILQGIDFLKDAAEVVYAHHERYDGTGYPRGLKG